MRQAVPSRSCNWNAASVSATICARTSRDSALTRSTDDGFRLCGMVLLPTCPGRLPSRTSSISLRCKW